jgi:hypothetical protein
VKAGKYRVKIMQGTVCTNTNLGNVKSNILVWDVTSYEAKPSTMLCPCAGIPSNLVNRPCNQGHLDSSARASRCHPSVGVDAHIDMVKAQIVQNNFKF